MPLIKNGHLIDRDTWRALADDTAIPEIGDIVVSLDRLARDVGALRERSGRVGVRLTSAQGPEDIAAYLDALDLVALEFPKFADGRAYSTARLLRQRYRFRGEVRAVGEVLADQVFFMARCGFDAFEMDRPDAADVFVRAQNEFRFVYQPAADRRAPAWSRRAAQPVVAAAE